MQTLRLSGPTLSEPRIVRLQKPLTTIGRSSDNDIVVSDAQTRPSHAYFLRGDGDVTVVAVDGDVLSGGKKKSKVKLQLGDKVQLGGLTIELIVEPVAAAVPKASGDADVLSALRKLHRFPNGCSITMNPRSCGRRWSMPSSRSLKRTTAFGAVRTGNAAADQARTCQRTAYGQRARRQTVGFDRRQSAAHGAAGDCQRCLQRR
ncbi:MAG: FHA domain-containing protein [Polyangia bacterium]